MLCYSQLTVNVCGIADDAGTRKTADDLWHLVRSARLPVSGGGVERGDGFDVAFSGVTRLCVRRRLYSEPECRWCAVDVTARRRSSCLGYEHLPQPAPCRHEVYQRRWKVSSSYDTIRCDIGLALENRQKLPVCLVYSTWKLKMRKVKKLKLILMRAPERTINRPGINNRRRSEKNWKKEKVLTKREEKLKRNNKPKRSIFLQVQLIVAVFTTFIV